MLKRYRFVSETDIVVDDEKVKKEDIVDLYNKGDVVILSSIVSIYDVDENVEILHNQDIVENMETYLTNRVKTTEEA